MRHADAAEREFREDEDLQELRPGNWEDVRDEDVEESFLSHGAACRPARHGSSAARRSARSSPGSASRMWMHARDRVYRQGARPE
jgi:hypothetical protein